MKVNEWDSTNKAADLYSEEWQKNHDNFGIASLVKELFIGLM